MRAALIATGVLAASFAIWQPPGEAAARPQGRGGSPELALCAEVNPAAITKITSVPYTETTSQVDTPAMKHCEYRGGLNTVSLMVVVGPGARGRFETSLKFPGVQGVPGVGDQASWEPVRGTLSMIAGERAVEVRISASHGPPPARLQLARQIVQLVSR